MTRARLPLLLALHLAVVLVLLGWTLFEARRQQAEIERTLVDQASILAGSLGPGLAAASNAVREFDEIVTWKLLDNARLLAEIRASDRESGTRLARIVEANGLDTVAFLDRDRRVVLALGEAPPPELLGELDAVLDGSADELILGSATENDSDHVAVAVATAAGGAVLVRIHALEARTFVQRLGVANLLERLVGGGGLLFLGYREEPGDLRADASWDGGPIPDRDDTGAKLRPVRDRLAFEVEVPVDAPAGVRAALRVGLDGTPLERAAASGTRRSLLVAIVLAGYALTVTGLALVSRLRSLEREESTRRLTESEAARRSSERLAAAGALTAGLAHEVRSPLNAIGLAAQRLERRLADDDDSATMAHRIRDEVRRLEGVLREFLDLARPVGDERRPVALGALAGEVLDLLRPEAESRGVHLEPVSGEAIVHVDRDAVRRAVINLIRNAVDASPAQGRIFVTVDREGHLGRLRIIDEGSGIADDMRDKVFEAFVTTRAGGAGLGLSLVKRVAEEHGGTCSLVNARGRGAEACLCLPAEVGVPS